MTAARSYPDLGVERIGHVATVELCRPPNNFFDLELIGSIADALEDLDNDPDCRAIVLAAQGKAFCAGADFSKRSPSDAASRAPASRLYAEAIRLFRTSKPIVAAVHGPAIGGGLGLALAADFRVSCSEARFSANFNRLGFHPGFGLSVTLPRLVGPQRSALLLYTGRRIGGDEAQAIGLVDALAPQAEVRSAAHALAEEIAASAPLAVVSTRRTLRGDLANVVEAATRREAAEQALHFATADFAEGVAAMAARRSPVFIGR